MPIPHSLLADPNLTPIPIFKDGKPGWIVGYADTISDSGFADIVLVCGRETFVRLPDYGRRITPRAVT